MLRNLGIYAVGSVGSRLFTFLLVPIYSFFLDPGEFGYYDICLATVMLLLPIITMQLREGALRFLLDAQNDTERTRIVTYCIMTTLRNVAICTAIGVLFQFLFTIRYLWLTILFAIMFALFELVQQLLRGLGHTKLFATCGVICSILVFAISVPLVVWTDMGVEGVFWGNILARAITMLIAEYKVKIFSNFISRNIDTKDVGRELMRYCLPMIVVNLIVIFIGTSNRFFIEHFLGLHDNGMYAVAVKFASVLEALALIVNQTWQETAIRLYGDSDRDVFYTKVLNAYIWTLVVLVVGISFVVRLLYGYIVGPEYQESVWLVYPLVLSSMFLSLLVFYDMGYHCSKNTSRQLPCLFMALVISIVTNYLFTIQWGIYGIVASINVTYLFMLIYKMIDTRKYMLLNIDSYSIIMLMLLILSGIMYYVLYDTLFIAAYLVAAFAVAIIACPGYIKHFLAEKLNLKTNRR